jgi:hypothetical protein
VAGTGIPDFFIVGAPKCGTTSLYEYLRHHPEIYMPSTKEPHFFGSDLNSAMFVRDKREYLDLFASADGARILGEASVYYLYSRMAAREIFQFNPSARVLIMLRNPVDMIYSLHSQAVSSAYEDILDFSEALAAEEDRARGRRIPDIADFPQGLLYSRIAMYAEQIRRYLDIFPANQVQVILFDDFIADPESIYVDVLRFLGVQDLGFRPEFSRINENRRLVSVRLEHFVKRRLRLRELLKAAAPRVYSAIYVAFRRLNARRARRQQMPQDLRQRLVSKFAPDIAELSKMLQRDLTSWGD